MEPDDARVVALMLHNVAWADESSHQRQPEILAEAFLDFAALAEQKHVDIVFVQRNSNIVAQSLFVLLSILASQSPVIPRYVVEGNSDLIDGWLRCTSPSIVFRHGRLSSTALPFAVCRHRKNAKLEKGSCDKAIQKL